MMRTDEKMSGIITPMITPLDIDQNIDIVGLEKLLEFLIKGGVSGVFIMGSSGEGPYLTNKNKEILIRNTVYLCKGRVKVLVGALEASTKQAIETCRLAEKYEADAVVITCPYYIVVSQKEIYNHIDEIAHHTTLPVMLYSIPSCTNNSIEIGTLRDLLVSNPNIIGIKDSAGDFCRFENILLLKNEFKDFVVFQGAEKLADLALMKGADGLVPGLSNVVPHLFKEMYDAIKISDDTALAFSIQEQINRLWELHQLGHWLPCLKMATSSVSGVNPYVQSPLSALDDNDRIKIEELLANVCVCN